MLSRRRYGVITALLILFTLTNSLQFFVGYLNTPSEHVYLGTVHNAGDYFYYLSQFTQGRESWVLGYDLMTGDYPGKTAVGWVNILLGRIFSAVGLTPITAYQVAVLSATGILLWLSWWFISRLMEGMGSGSKFTAFLLFLTANAFPIWNPIHESFPSTYYSFWFNTGNPFVRLGNVPHHLIVSILTIWVPILLLGGSKPDPVTPERSRLRRWIAYGAIGLSGLTIGSLNPVQWLMVFGVMAIVGITASPSFPFLFRRKLSKVLTCSTDRTVFTKLLLFMFSGLVPVLYYRQLFDTAPYLQLRTWEAVHQNFVPVRNFLLGFGPVGILGGLGIPFLLSMPSRLAKFSALMLILSTSLFFSPLPATWSLQNVRFLPQIMMLFLAVSAACALRIFVRWIEIFCIRVFRKTIPSRGMMRAALVVVIALMVPSWIIQIRELSIPPSSSDITYYIHRDMYRFLSEMSGVTGTGETFLVAWPYNLAFPAISGRRVFHAHELLTIDYAGKDLPAYGFFTGAMTPGEMGQFLRDHSISFVIAPSWIPLPDGIPGLTVLRNDSGFILYHVL